MKRVVSFVFCLTTLLFPRLSFSSPGETAAPFLEIGSGARPLSMGAAFTAVTDDPQIVTWNVGGLGLLKTKAVTFSYSTYLEDSHYGSAGFVTPFPGYGVLGLNVTAVDSGNIPRTQESAAGGFSTNDGEYSERDLVGGISYGMTIRDKFGVGATLKRVSEEIDSYSAGVWAVDAGVLWKSALPDINLGWSINHIGPSLDGFKLPLTSSFGAAISKIRNTLITFDVVTTVDNDTGLRTGLEFTPVELLSLRAGYKSDSDAGDQIRLGAGFHLHSFDLDYAFLQSRDFAADHQVSITFKFS